MTPSTTRPVAARPALNTAARIAALLLWLTAAFQLALALGAPFGRAAWGGTHEGAVPAGPRVVSAVAVVVYVLLGFVALDRLAHGKPRRIIMRVVAVWMGLGVVLNALSPSWLESLIWVPVTLVLAVCLWLGAK